MKVWLGYECYDNFCEVWRNVVKVFDDEVKALVWQDELKPTEREWREYTGMDVE